MQTQTKPTNLIVFPGGRRKSEADKLLLEFIDLYSLDDGEDKKSRLTTLILAIFAYVATLPND